MKNLDRSELEQVESTIMDYLQPVEAFDWATKMLDSDQKEELLVSFDRDTGNELLTGDERGTIEHGSHLDGDTLDSRWQDVYNFYAGSAFSEVCRKLDSDAVQALFENIGRDLDVDVVGEALGISQEAEL